MPLLRCTNPDCGHEWFETSQLAEGADCIECGGPTLTVDGEEEDQDTGSGDWRGRGTTSIEKPRSAVARNAARALLRKHKISDIPVPVRRIAELEGLEVRETSRLGALRAQLVGNTIEVAEGDMEVVKRFSVAHELGHHRMETVHSQGRRVEREADAFAGELLVPGPKLLEAIQVTTDTRQLARMFQVSQQALRIAAEQHRKGDSLT